jgi:hypothetical protein
VTPDVSIERLSVAALAQAKCARAKQSDEPDHDQVDGDDEVQQLGHDEDQDTGQQRDQRCQSKVQVQGTSDKAKWADEL